MCAAMQESLSLSRQRQNGAAGAAIGAREDASTLRSMATAEDARPPGPAALRPLRRGRGHRSAMSLPQEKEEGRRKNGAAAAADASASVKGENVRLCSPMFAYVRLIGKKCLRACLETTRGAVFVEKAGWRGATKENIPGGSSTEEQRSQTAFSP